MEITEAIQHIRKTIKENEHKAEIAWESYRLYPNNQDLEKADNCEKCADEHRQLLEWLIELQEYRNRSCSADVYEQLVDIQDYISSVFNPNNSESVYLAEVDMMIDKILKLM